MLMLSATGFRPKILSLSQPVGHGMGWRGEWGDIIPLYSAFVNLTESTTFQSCESLSLNLWDFYPTWPNDDS